MNLKLIKHVITKKPYSYYFLTIFFIYMIINIILSEFYITIQYIPYYLETIKWSLLLFSALSSIIIGLLIAININLMILRYRDSKKLNLKLTPIGFLLGLSTGICPACITGLFPFLFSLFGFSLLTLPFKGLEIQVLSMVLLLISTLLLLKETKDCKI